MRHGRYWTTALSCVTLALVACRSQPPRPESDLALPPSALEITASVEATATYPVPAPLPPPDNLRPCCTFGHDLKVSFLGVPIPWFRINNMMEPEAPGTHRYNNGSAGYIDDVFHLDSEKLGIVYSHRGGFIDLAHLRDSADNVLFLFSQIWPRLGHASSLQLSPELADRRIELLPFMPPASFAERYALAAVLASRLAYQLAVWHEIGQWYGYRSVWFFSEQSSAFSPEDLYSNALGVRLGLLVLLQGDAATAHSYSAALTHLIPPTLKLLQATSSQQTRAVLDQLDGCWWNSQARLPEKFALLRRNYGMGEQRLPVQPASETAPPLALTIPEHWQTIPLDQLAQLRLYPRRKSMGRLPPPPASGYWSNADFAALSAAAETADAVELKALKSRPTNSCAAQDNPVLH